MDRPSVLISIDTVQARAGTEIYVTEIARRLSRSFDVHLCCLEDSPSLRSLGRFCATAVFPVKQVFRPSGLAGIRRLREYINRHSIDLVHSFLPKATIVTVLAAKHSRARVIVTSRRSLGYYYTRPLLTLFRYLNRHTTRVLANSESVRRFTIETEHVAPGKVDVLYNGVDVGSYPAPVEAGCRAGEALGIPPGVPVVGMVGNYRPVKDHDLFLRAAKVVAGRVPEARFLLVGDGPLRPALACLAAELGIAGRVFFTAGKGQVRDYLARMSVGCLTSRSEGFSNAILEYMASGLPVVATGVGGNAEAIQQGVTGYLVAERSPEALAAPLIALLQHAGERARMGRRGMERCRAEFDLDGAIDRLEQYYRALIASPPA